MECVAASGFYALRFPDALWALQGLVAASGFYALRFPDALWAPQGLVAASAFYALRFPDALWALQGLVAAPGFYALRFSDAHWAHFTLKRLFNTIPKKHAKKNTSKAWNAQHSMIPTQGRDVTKVTHRRR